MPRCRKCDVEMPPFRHNPGYGYCPECRLVSGASMEAMKGCIYKRGKVGTKYMYLICVNVLTDREIAGLAGDETIIMSDHCFHSPLADAVETMTKYEPPYPLGEVGTGIVTACQLKPDQLKLVKKKTG